VLPHQAQAEARQSQRPRSPALYEATFPSLLSEAVFQPMNRSLCPRRKGTPLPSARIFRWKPRH